MNVKPRRAANPAPVSNLPNGLQRLTTGPWALGLATTGHQVFELTSSNDLDRRAAAMVKGLQALLAQGVEKPAVVSSHNGQMLLVTERSLESKDPIADIVAKYDQLLAQSAAKGEGEARFKLEQADQKAPRTVEQLERALLSRRPRPGHRSLRASHASPRSASWSAWSPVPRVWPGSSASPLASAAAES